MPSRAPVAARPSSPGDKRQAPGRASVYTKGYVVMVWIYNMASEFLNEKGTRVQYPALQHGKSENHAAAETRQE